MGVEESTARRLAALVAEEQASARLPSLTAGVVRSGDLVWSGVRGDTPDTSGQPPDPATTQYRIGSITKTMTTVLVLQLRDEGALDLDDRLADHVGDAPFGDRSVRELLAHLTGMPAEPAGSWWERSPGVDWAELHKRNLDADTVLGRGRQYHYSNLGFALVGEAVSRLRGGSWWDVLAERLLEPLGMSQTTRGPGSRAAQGYSVHPWSGRLLPEPHQDTGAMAPAGQVWSTVPDLARFAAFLADPDPAVLSPASVEEMTVPRSGTPDSGRTVTYGLGTRLLVTPDGHALMGHTGSMPGFLAGMLVDREHGTAAVCMANATTGLRCEGLPTDLLSALAASEPDLPSAWRPSGTLPEWIEEILGLWYWGTTALELAWDGGALRLRQLGTDRAMRYRPEGTDAFVGVSGYHTGETLAVQRRPDGAVSHLECATFVYTRSPYDPDAPIPGGPPTL